MKIHRFELGPIATNAFLVWNEITNESILIDAPHDAWQIIGNFVKEQELILIALLVTHGHWDHIAGLKHFKDHLKNLKIFAHQGDKGWIEDPAPMNHLLPPELQFSGVPVDHVLKDAEILNIAGITFEVRSAPGHAPGSVIFYNQANNVAFVGDVIFKGSIGRSDLPGGSFKTLEDSIKNKVYTLPDNTRLYPGHGETTTVGFEKKYNSFVRA